MNPKLLTLVVVIVAMATMAPVCVLAGGDTRQISETYELSRGALIEVIGENAEVRIHSVQSQTLELDVTLNNEEFVDFYTQLLSDRPEGHLVISATTSTGGTNTANSIIEIGLPRNVDLTVQTTNHPITADDISVNSATLSSADGNISIQNSSGEFDLTTTNSEIRVQLRGGMVNATTTNAHVWFEGTLTHGSNSLSTTNGDIAVRFLGQSNVTVTGNTHNGDVSVNGGAKGVELNGDSAQVSYRAGVGTATLNITNGPGAIHINPAIIAVFDGDK